MNPREVLNEVRKTWQPPAELQRSRPRDVRMTGAGKALLMLVYFMMLGGLVIGTLLYVKATRDHDQRRELIQTGNNATAAVIRRWTRRGEHPSYMVEYSYQAEGRDLVGSINVGRKGWDRLEPGATLSVRYLPRNPQVHLVPGYEGSLMPLWLPFLVFGAMALGSGLMMSALAGQRRLLADGRPAPAVVTHYTKAEHGKVAHFAFATLSGAIVRGKCQPSRKPLPEGSIACVLYEPDHAAHNGTYPLSLFRAARR